jgi:uncharacterized cupin superfamily protein
VIAHWDEVEPERYDWPPDSRAWWRDLGRAAGTRAAGVRRMEVDPESQSVTAHVHTVEEEIVFVLAGSGRAWQDGRTCTIGPGDCIVYVPDQEAHTLIADEAGLDVLVFGTRDIAEFSYLPRVGQAYARGLWFDVAGVGSRPAETAPVRMEPGRRGPPPHCHSAEEEIFVVLDGDGVLELWPTPGARRLHGEIDFEEHRVRAGHVVSRPPATRVAHSFRAGDRGLTYLAYGTREPNDVCYYPRSNKIFWRGVGIIARLEPLDYDDGEPDD